MHANTCMHVCTHKVDLIGPYIFTMPQTAVNTLYFSVCFAVKEKERNSIDS